MSDDLKRRLGQIRDRSEEARRPPPAKGPSESDKVWAVNYLQKFISTLERAAAVRYARYAPICKVPFGYPQLIRFWSSPEGQHFRCAGGGDYYFCGRLQALCEVITAHGLRWWPLFYPASYYFLGPDGEAVKHLYSHTADLDILLGLWPSDSGFSWDEQSARIYTSPEHQSFFSIQERSLIERSIIQGMNYTPINSSHEGLVLGVGLG
jgi:hypothetical protein